MQQDVKTGYYRHYKNKDYTVLGTVFHSETEETMVLYRQEYGDRNLWVRPFDMFFENVTVDGETIPRFAYLGPAEKEELG
ncbi:MAG: hypothetical protein CMJ76_03665 [Planctomycetaceae bacterium]|nr:hypothetical protein [Planctomycetaceae bacterium]|tara:strand:+ start:472 stop:711 length:240 start_codon:yes stop_codon:yes gene_type:complete